MVINHFCSKQMDAAINHYIEAGCTIKALEAAVGAKQWKKAVHIIKVIDDVDSVRKYYQIIAAYFASIKVSMNTNLDQQLSSIIYLILNLKIRKCSCSSSF